MPAPLRERDVQCAAHLCIFILVFFTVDSTNIVSDIAKQPETARNHIWQLGVAIKQRSQVFDCLVQMAFYFQHTIVFFLSSKHDCFLSAWPV